MKIVVMIAAALLCANTAAAQDIKMSREIERLAERATQSVNVTLDGTLLQLAGKFLSSSDPEQRIAKSLISNLKAIYVRSFEFANVGEYSSADVESLRAQLKVPVWSRIVGVRSGRSGEDVDVFLKMDKDKMAGVVVIAAEARRLTVVNIDGPIDLEQLALLGGQFGIPKLDVEKPRK